MQKLKSPNIFKLIALFAILLLPGYDIFSQQAFFAHPDTTINKSDPVVIRLQEYAGEIQWQRSYDASLWKDIPGATADTFVFVADTTTYFRARVVKSHYDPFYSDTTLVIVYELKSSSPLRIYGENPWYWEYKGEPVLLLGGSYEDNMYQFPNWYYGHDDPDLSKGQTDMTLEEHLDLMVEVGANYIRSNLSSRNHGNRFPYKKINGTPGHNHNVTDLYDLDQWDPIWVERLETFLQMCYDREIVVSVEFFDRFDLFRPESAEGNAKNRGNLNTGWVHHPWNPDRNINYTEDSSGLPGGEKNFHEYHHEIWNAVPPYYDWYPPPPEPIVLETLEKYVDKVLSITFRYDNIIYIIENETYQPIKFGRYWVNYINKKALEAGKSVFVTNMIGDSNPDSGRQQEVRRGKIYTFYDYSQNNHNTGQNHYDNYLYVREDITENGIKPINNVKIYGSTQYGTAIDAKERFWRAIFAGCASARFHRPGYENQWGLGLNDAAQTQIRSARMLSNEFNIFSSEPNNDILGNRNSNEAYCLADTAMVKKHLAVYFTDGGSVDVDMSGFSDYLVLKWLDIEKSEWLPPAIYQGEDILTLITPSTGQWVAVAVPAKIWTGLNGNPGWDDGANWKPEGVPTGREHVLIPGDAAKYPVLNSEKDVRSIIIQPGASLIINSEGGLTAAHYIIAGGELTNSGTLRIPTAGNITIEPGGALTIEEGADLTVKPGGSLKSYGTLTNNNGVDGLLIESDENNGSGSVIINNPGVNATVQRWIKGAQWHIISSPVSGQLIQDFIPSSQISQNSGGAYAMTHYYESRYGGSGGWAPYYTGSTEGYLGQGKGYLAGRSSDGELLFSGVLAHSDVDIEIFREAYGWNAVGNPFPSAIGVRDGANSTQNFLQVNTGKLDESYAALYIYDPVSSSYKVINGVVEDIDQINQHYIQPGQGFIVKAKDKVGAISFTTGMRIHEKEDDSPFHKKSAASPWLTVRLKAGNDYREASTLIAFNRNMTGGLDPAYDAGQFGADPGFNLYTRLVEDDKGIKFAIQALPDYEFENMVIPLGFDFTEGGEVTFSAAGLRLPAGARIVLEDREQDVFTDLIKENYTVSLDADTEGPGRFFIHADIRFVSPEETNEWDVEEKIKIYSYGKEVFIVGEVPPNTYATLYDIAGRKMKTQRLMHSDRNSFMVDNIVEGIYLIRVSGERTEKTGRVFIK